MPQPISIQAGKLTKRQYAPRVGSLNSPWRQSVADTLSPQRMAQIMREADEGSVEAYLTLAEEMEEREPHYASVLFTRKLAVAAIGPVLEAPKDSVDPKIIEAVEDRVLHKPEFEGLVLDLMDGVPKGFSCVEVVWDFGEKEWNPVGYEFTPQRHFVFDMDTLSVPRLRTDDSPDQGAELEPFKWLVHMPRLRSGVPIRTGLARTIAVTYAAKRWTVADWMAFLDIYGIPVRLGKYPAHMADKKAALLRAVRSIGSDAAAVIPKEMEVEIIESKGGTGGTTLFQQGAEYWDKQTSKVVLGQTMTTDDGSSLAQSKIHQDTKFEIRDADSRSVSACIDKQLIKPFIDLNFGAQKVYPRVRIRQRKAEDLVPLLTATKIFVDLGGKVQASEVRDRLGFAEPEEGSELLEPTAKPPVPGLPGVDAPGKPDPDASKKGPAAKPGDKVTKDDKKQSELNRLLLQALRDVRPDLAFAELDRAMASDARVYDEVDVTAHEELEDWRALEETNVGRLLRLIQEAKSYGEARALLDELANDEGEVLDIAALTVSLARSTFKLRGNGDATDQVKP
jgi:phage gp29-like protein